MTYAGVERVVLQGRKTSGKCLCQNAVTACAGEQMQDNKVESRKVQ
jgi:hypothetical protein